jgi:hypothetical protein
MRVSFCTTCCNRLHQFNQTFDRNCAVVAASPHVEWIIFNHSSTDGLDAYISERLDTLSHRILYAKNLSSDSWHLSVAKNIAHRLASGDILMNLDCDNYIGDAAKWLVHDFQAGYDLVHCWSGSFADGTCGRVALSRSLFYNLRGYDEEFHPMGYQDRDLINRAAAWGAKILRRHSHGSVAIPNTKEASISQCSKPGMTWNDYMTANKARSEQNIAQGYWVANRKAGWRELHVEITSGRRLPLAAPAVPPSIRTSLFTRFVDRFHIGSAKKNVDSVRWTVMHAPYIKKRGEQ